MTAREKVLNLEQQVMAIINRAADVAGSTQQIICPFCGLATFYGQVLCCNEAAEVIDAVLDHIEFKQGIERVERVMNHVADMQSHALLN